MARPRLLVRQLRLGPYRGDGARAADADADRGAATIWLDFGVTIGVISAVKRRTIVDRGAMGFALFGISAPVFWLGLMALYLVWKKPA